MNPGFVVAVYLQKRQVLMEIHMKNTGLFVHNHILIWINQEASSTTYRYLSSIYCGLPAYWVLWQPVGADRPIPDYVSYRARSSQPCHTLLLCRKIQVTPDIQLHKWNKY